MAGIEVVRELEELKVWLASNTSKERLWLCR